MKSDGWVPVRDIRNYADGQLTATAPRSTGGGETMPAGTEAARALARDLWTRGYSLRYIAGRLGVSRTAAAELIGMARIVSRERRRGRA